MYKVLIVDDERMIRMGIKMAIPWQSLGIGETFAAASGREALEIAERERPDILISDIRMTEMTGLELIAKIREQNEEMRIIVLTGYDDFEYARECLRMKVDEFLLKPVDEQLLKEQIEKLVGMLDEGEENLKKEKQLRRILGTADQVKLEQIMNDFLFGREVREEVYEKLEREYEYDVNSPLRVAVLFHPIHDDGTIDNENGLFTLLNIKNLLISFLDAQSRGITFENKEGQLIVVLFDTGKADEIQSLVEDFTELILDEYEIATKVVLGSRVEGFPQMNISYREAQMLLEQQKNSYHKILEKRENKGRLELFKGIFEELRTAMETNIGNTSRVLRIFDSFCNATESYNISDAYARKCCFEIASSLYYSYCVDSGENPGDKMYVLLNTLVNAERKQACEYTRDFLDTLLEPQSENSHEIVNAAKRDIMEHLSEDISVSSIAMKYYVTPNYFSRLFKRVTGEGCNEYIVRKRIEQAKSLLETTNLKTGAIAQTVGYRDTNYFSMAFKKHMGVSPTQYRRNIRENGQ